MEIIKINTKRRVEFVDITHQVEEIIRKKDVQEGICIIFCPHTTAGLTINENADPSVRKDIISHLEEIVPFDKSYSHLEGNADSHIKSSLLGSSLNLIIHQKKLVLGTWQGIYFCEFDGPRARSVYVKIIEDREGG
jgi:secondary thiamine-phosphate synthase enzyme